MLFLCAVMCLAAAHAQEEKPVDPFSDFDYYIEHLDELNDDNFRHLCFKAQCYMSDAALKQNHTPVDPAHDYDRARDCFVRAAELKPDEPMPYRGLAVIYQYGYNDPGSALKYAQRAIDLGWKYYDVYMIAGFILYDSGQKEHGIKLLMYAKEAMEKVSDREFDLLDSQQYKKIVEILEQEM